MFNSNRSTPPALAMDPRGDQVGLWSQEHVVLRGFWARDTCKAKTQRRMSALR